MVQSVSNKIECYHTNNGIKDKYYEFSPNSLYFSGKNLQSYTYEKSVHEFSGSFNFTVREEVNTLGFVNPVNFFDEVEILDIVCIYNKDTDTTPSFYGVITDIGYSASANGQKIIQIQGKSIEFLFEFLTIALDATAMAYLGDEQILTNLNSVNKINLNNKEANIKTAFKEQYKMFTQTLKGGKLGNPYILDIIDVWYGDDYLDIPETLTYSYPITSNLYTNSVMNFISYMKNFFPEETYEFYGIIIDGKPKIRIREVPFNPQSWVTLTSKKINPLAIQNYTVNRSMQEVYTVFCAMLEGSPLATELYKKATATTQGYAITTVNEEKRKIYGYKPLFANFIGYATNLTNNNDLNKIFKELTTKLDKSYSRLDEMYYSTISTVLLDRDYILPQTISGIEQNGLNIGERLNFLGGEFYVDKISVSWRYGQSTNIVYNCSRGGIYDEFGNFYLMQGITDQFKELK